MFSAPLSDEASLKDCDRWDEDGNEKPSYSSCVPLSIIKKTIAHFLSFCVDLLINPLLTADMNV